MVTGCALLVVLLEEGVLRGSLEAIFVLLVRDVSDLLEIGRAVDLILVLVVVELEVAEVLLLSWELLSGELIRLSGRAIRGLLTGAVMGIT